MSTDDGIGYLLMALIVVGFGCAVYAFLDDVHQTKACQTACGYRVLAGSSEVDNRIACMCKEAEGAIKVEFTK